MLAINNIVETIKESFPQVPTGLIVRDLNTIHKNFAAITNICRTVKKDLLTNIHETTSWDLSLLYNKKINTVFYVDFLDKNNKLLETFYKFSFDKKTQILEITHELVNNITGLDNEVEYVKIDFSYIPNDLITTNFIKLNWESLENNWENELGNWNLDIPDEFSEAIEAKLMEKYIAKYRPDAGLLSYYHGIYNEKVMQAKIYYETEMIGFNIDPNQIINYGE